MLRGEDASVFDHVIGELFSGGKGKSSRAPELPMGTD